MKEGRKPEYTEKTPGDELKNLEHKVQLETFDFVYDMNYSAQSITKAIPCSTIV